jgi:hypothetical protein
MFGAAPAAIKPYDLRRAHVRLPRIRRILSCAQRAAAASREAVGQCRGRKQGFLHTRLFSHTGARIAKKDVQLLGRRRFFASRKPARGGIRLPGRPAVGASREGCRAGSRVRARVFATRTVAGRIVSAVEMGRSQVVAEKATILRKPKG